MKFKINPIVYVFGLAFIAGGVVLQAPSALVYSSSSPSRSVARSASDVAAKSFGDLPLSFEANRGQTDSRVKFLSRGSGYNLFLTAKEAVIGVHVSRASTASTRALPKSRQRPLTTDGVRSSFVGMKLVGANAGAEIIGLDELPGKSNYFIGRDPKKWRLNVPNYSRVKYQNAYPGVDVVFYGKGRQLEYDFKVAPGASFKPIRIAFDGARRVLLDDSGDLVIETPAGEIHQRKPAIYQQAGDEIRAISGGYVIAGESEVAFEVGDYDQTRALVIDPVLVYSTSIGGSVNDSATAVAVDAAGNAYIAGTTMSTDFPTVNPFQAKPGSVIDFVSDAFVTKLNASGSAVLYSTYLGGAKYEVSNSVAVDAAGNVYLTGNTISDDFPTTPGAFQINANTGGDAYVTKLNPAGNALVYSTRLGGSAGPYAYSAVLNNGLGIAVDAEGSAYVTGYTSSPGFPVKKAVQDKIDRGSIRCCTPVCLYDGLTGIIEDAFVTKLNPSGTGLVYSTYVGGSGQEEAFAIALDASGSAYIAGRTCSRDFTNGAYGGGKSDAFVMKVSSSGKQFVYSKFIGGSGDDVANSVVVDSGGNAYIAGQTDSSNFFTSPSAFQSALGGSVSYITNDGGGSWSAGTGLPNVPVNVLAVDPTNPLTVYAGLGTCVKPGGFFKSSDGGNTWRSSGLAGLVIRAIAIDPQNPSTVYADSYKSLDGGATWTPMVFPESTHVLGADTLAIDPVNTMTLYMVSGGLGTCGEAVYPSVFLKTTDGGHTWAPVRNGATAFFAGSVLIDPKNSSTIYASNFSSFLKSTDGGSTWRIPYEGSRNIGVLAIDPTNTSTLYLREFVVSSTPPIEFYESLLKSTDGGATFVALILKSPSISSLVVDSTNSSVLYAAVSFRGSPGGVIKSTDSGTTWSATDLTGVPINTLTIDSLSSRLYAGASFDVDGFVAKFSQDGSTLAYSTYLGTRSADAVADIAVDGAGNAYVTGQTRSDRFPAKDALLGTKPGGAFNTSAFVTRVNLTGTAILFSSYLGNGEPGFGSAIAVDAAGKAYVVGTTGLPVFLPSAALPESAHGGFDAFVAKISPSPRIHSVSISGKNLIVNGEGFDRGAVILLAGVEQRTRNDESNPSTVLIGKKTARNIFPGQSFTIQVRNPDGLMSQLFGFSR